VDPTTVDDQICLAGFTLTGYWITGCVGFASYVNHGNIVIESVLEPADNGWEWLPPNCESPGFASTKSRDNGMMLAMVKIGTMAF
jgi:hypothetical protein